jgi:YaiO family outer membrane protein
MKPLQTRSLIIFILLTSSLLAQTAKPGTTVPQGSGLPGLNVEGPNGPGYLEVGGSRSELTSPQPNWTDAYVRGQVAVSEKNGLSADVERQARFGDSGYYGSLGLTHVFTENLYTNVFAGSSVGGAFIPKFRTDGLVNYKLLPKKNLVANLGFGYDKSKTANWATRVQVGGTYYFRFPIVLQGGATFTHANPGSVNARTYNLAVTQGRYKEHYLSFRAEIGREAYEVIAPQSVLANFPIHNYSGTWRQWVGMNWGFNFNFQRELNPYYNRNGATLGLFVDF